jgi:hypothetical protein
MDYDLEELKLAVLEKLKHQFDYGTHYDVSQTKNLITMRNRAIHVISSLIDASCHHDRMNSLAERMSNETNS